MQEYEAKLQKLRQYYIQPQDQRRMTEVQIKLNNLIAESNLSEEPVVKEIIKTAYKEIQDIDFLLSYDRKLMFDQDKERERIRLFERRDILEEYIIGMLGGDDIKKKIKAIKSSIDKRVEGIPSRN